MGIPHFESNGLLPPAMVFAEDDDGPIHSGHPCTLEEMEDRFVTAFPASLSRPVLYQEVVRLLTQAKQLLQCLLLVVSGQFVTYLIDPRDIFIVLDVPGGMWTG